MSRRHFSLLLLACMVGGSLQVCAPDCTGVDPGTFVRDPTDCTRYYVCLMVNGEMISSDEPVDCPDGEYFNVEHTTPRCDPISTAPSDYCSDLCNPCVPDCNLDNAGSVQPDPFSCTTYFVCLADGHTLEEECPDTNPYFDYQIGNCQTDATLCYNYCDPCVPHCTADNELLADPLDCHRFYLCTPPTITNFLCPSDGVFDPETGECGNFACNTICPSTAAYMYELD